MKILPVGYTTADVVYQWTAGRGVNIASDMKLSQVSFSISGGQHCFCFKLSFLSLFVTSSLPKKIIISNYGCNVHSQFFIKTMQHKKFKLAEHSLQSLRQCVFSVRARLQCVFLVWPDQLANTITKLQIQQRRYKYEYEYKYNYSETQLHNSTVKSNGVGWEVHQGLSLVDWSCFIAGNGCLMKVFFLFFVAVLLFAEESSFVFLFLFIFGAALSLAIMDRGGRQDGRNRREILLPQRGWRRGRN